MRQIPEEAAKEILSGSRLGVVALTADATTYALPLFYGYDGKAVYFHCHPGLKDMWIDSTEEACMVVVHVESENIWESVQVFGPLEKLTLNTDIDAARSALFQVPFPPAQGNLPSGTPSRPEGEVYYMRLTPTRIAGMGSTYETPDAATD